MTHPLTPSLARRAFLSAGAAGMAALAANSLAPDAAARELAVQQPAGEDKKNPTRFQIACMTLCYSRFPLQRALTGIRAAGYSYVAWGTSHMEANGKQVPVMAADAPPAQAKELGSRCRDLGLEPLMMFTGTSPDAKNGVEVLRARIHQAAAAKIPQILTFGGSKGGEPKVWIERLKQLAPIARDNGVMIVIKQHGGNMGTGAGCAKITQELNDDSVRVNFDAGNVMDYNRIPPEKVLADMNACASEVRSLCIKDHRDFPAPHGDCGPGLGEIDHFRLLHPVAFTGRAMPLCCENIFVPGRGSRVPRPAKPEGVDALARRAREFLEMVIQVIQA